ncbi:MAG: hypothetical protein O3B47_02205, partial [bacterium]|nr:hypothetical protein [bacterium]
MRLHRSLKNLARTVNPTKVADRAEDYLEGARLYNADLKGIGGIVSKDRIKALIRKIDSLEREILKHEDKIDRLQDRRRLSAAKLEDYLLGNFDVLKEYFEPG